MDIERIFFIKRQLPLNKKEESYDIGNLIKFEMWDVILSPILKLTSYGYEIVLTYKNERKYNMMQRF